MTSWDFSVFKVRDMTPAQCRWSGVVMLPLSLFIVVLGTGFVLLALEVPVPADWLPADTHIEPRTEEQHLSTFQFFGLMGFCFLVLTFGTTALVQAIIQIVSGRRNMLLLRVMLVIVAIVFAAGVVACAVLGRRIGTGNLNG